MRAKIFFAFFALLLMFGCNLDEDITREIEHEPVIEIDSETGIYTIKVGQELTITPKYEYVDDALYAWTIDGKLISSNPIFKYTWDQKQELYLNLRVDTKNGYAEEELKVEVLELLPPAINIYVPAKGLKVKKGIDFVLAPDIANKELDNFKIEWIRDGKIVSNNLTYTFNEENLGKYLITIKASNIDGETVKEIEIEVVENMPYAVEFLKPYYTATETTRYTFAERSVFLRPRLEYFEHPLFVWSVNGKTIEGATSQEFKFTPKEAGFYSVSVVVTEEQNGISVESTVKVECVSGSQNSIYRAANANSSAYSNKVYEFLPAPGQFVNELGTAGFSGTESSFTAANQYATDRIANKKYVSLGSFGGYLIVGFDHSIPNKGGYDFSIQGNAFDSSNEPGIVWVMQDVNGNGLPDDEWYELKGSENGKSSTIQNYEVTYYRPASARSNVHWTDNLGNSGSVDANAYHQQDYYYPLWMDKESYTLTGTALLPRNSQNPGTGYWSNDSYEWGYADNWGNDVLGGDSYDGSGQVNGFKISNAIYADGTPIQLDHIDFIKVQCAVLAKSGVLGEVSTEVFSFEDLTIKK